MFCLDDTDTLEAWAGTASKIDYTIHGLVAGVFTQLAAGVLGDSADTVIYTAGAAIAIVSVTLVNTHTSAVTVNLRLDPTDGGTNERYLIPPALPLGIKYSLFFDGSRFTTTDANGNIMTAATAGTHASNHENGGGDEVSVTDLSGLLADDQHILDAEVVTLMAAQDFDRGGYYDTRRQNDADLASKGASYWFDGDAYYIDTGETFQSLFRNDFSILTTISPDDGQPASHTFILGTYETGVTDAVGLQDRTDGSILFTYHSDGDVSYAHTGPIWSDGDSAIKTIVAVADASVGGVGGLKLYIDGNEDPLPQGDGSTSGVTFADYTNARTLMIGARNNAGSANQFWGGRNFRTLLFNLALTDNEQKPLSSGAPVPFKYIGASQTAKYTATFDADIAGWTLQSDDETSTFEWDTDHVVLAVTDVGTNSIKPNIYKSVTFTHVLGKSYKVSLEYTVNSGTCILNEVYWSDAVVETGINETLTGSGTYSFVLGEWDGADDNVWFGFDGRNEFNISIDNISITQIGCVLQLEQDGIGWNQWLDKSGNELHDAVSGALPTNLPVNHIEKFVDLTVTVATSFTLPKGYMITAIIVKETAGNAVTGGVCVGFSAGGEEVVNAMTVGANAEVNLTLISTGVFGANFDDDSDEIHIAAHTAWNSASLKVRVWMQRMTLN